MLFEFSFRPYLPVDQTRRPEGCLFASNNYLTFFDSPIHSKIFFLTVLYQRRRHRSSAWC